MRKCLAPFFVGQFEAGLDEHADDFDVVLPLSLVGANSGSLEAIVSVNQGIRDFVVETVAVGDAPLVLCGDCLSAIGCLAGLERSDARPNYLLWFDAHGDFHTYETTISGHLGGMPLAMITGRGEQDILSRVGLAPFPEERICHVGARDLEPGERESLGASAIVTASRAAGALNRIPKGSSVWVHFDTDYINPIDAPAMRYPATGGPRALKVRSEFDVVARQLAIIGLSVSGWAPHLDRVGRGSSTAEVCWQTVSAIRRR